MERPGFQLAEFGIEEAGRGNYRFRRFDDLLEYSAEFFNTGFFNPRKECSDAINSGPAVSEYSSTQFAGIESGCIPPRIQNGSYGDSCINESSEPADNACADSDGRHQCSRFIIESWNGIESCARIESRIAGACQRFDRRCCGLF